MDQLQQTELDQRKIERDQQNRITALHIAMEINKESSSTSHVMSEAEKVLKFIEGQ